MRIIHCLRAPVGGLFRHVLDLTAAQAALGHDVGMIADANATDSLTEQRLAAVAPALTLGIHRVPMHRAPGLSDFQGYRAVTRICRPLALDVLHGHGAKGGAYARLAGRTLGATGQKIGIFYTPHGGSLNYTPDTLEGRVFLGMERVLDRLTTGLIFESGYAARIYGERIGKGRAQRRVIHNGLQPSDFAPVVLEPAATDFIFIGELRAFKGVDTLLHALATLNRGRDKPLTATIVGSGPETATLKALASELGLDASVTFPGAMPAAIALRKGRIMVVPSRKESFPYVVLEAAAAGIPMVVTNVGGIPEIVEGTPVELIEPGNVTVLADAMARTHAYPETAQSNAESLKKAVAERFTVERMTQSVLDFYNARSPLKASGQSPLAAASPPGKDVSLTLS